MSDAPESVGPGAPVVRAAEPTGYATPPIARPVQSPTRVRIAAAGVLAGSLTILTIAAWVRPDPRGYGTHQQLGQAPCGMLVLTGLPCPTCGMTTAFAHTVRGHLIAAFLAQPAGLVLALLTGAAAVISLFALLSGRWPPRPRRWISATHFFWILLAIFVGGWAFKLLVTVASHTDGGRIGREH